MVYVKKLEKDQLLSLYYLVLLKEYPKEENIWESTLAIQHLQKLIITYYKKYLEMSMAILSSINKVLPIAEPTVKLIKLIKRKNRSAKTTSTNKHAKRNWKFNFNLVFDPVLMASKSSVFKALFIWLSLNFLGSNFQFSIILDYFNF